MSNSITQSSRRRTKGSRPSSSPIILNLETGPEWGHFVPVKTANGVTLDYDTREEFRPGHYAFLVSDAEFDAAFARIRAQGVQTPIRGALSPARSIICTAVAASISRTRTVT